MKTLIIFFTICLSLLGSAQGKKPDFSDSCSNMINILSYYWKLDSLGSNGFRLYTYDRLLKCKLNDVMDTVILSKLGRPNNIRLTNLGTQYVYYYYDEKSIPPKRAHAFECGYIFFLIDTKTKRLLFIDQGVLDY